MLAVTAIPGEEDFSQRRIVTTYSLKGMTHRVFIDPVSKLEESQVAVLCKESLSESEILSEPDHEL